MQLLGPIGRLYLSFQEIHSLVFKLCSNVLPDISKGPRVLGGPGCSLHVTPPGPQGSQWDFQDLLAPARADPCPPPQSLLHVAPSLPRGRGSTKRTMAVGTGLSPQTRPAMSRKSSCNVFLLQRAFQARDKRDEYYAGKVKLGSGMKSGHCLLHVSLGGVSCV